jgi:ubiquinone/menaquinone biosynthesis C-methylase UbiE
MSGRSARERDYHDRVFEKNEGACWANVKPAGQLRQDMRARMASEYIKISPGMRILEIGCGNGEFSSRFLNNGAEMHCVDISGPLIGILEERYAGTNLKFETADIEHLPYADGYFDGITGNGILHHLNIDICIKEIHRVLKKNGRIFFAEPNLLNPEVFLETRIRWIGRLAQKTEDETAFLKWELKRALEKNGFSSVVVSPFDFLQPLTPVPFIGIVSKIGFFLEKVPLLKEVAGSLRITAEKL